MKTGKIEEKTLRFNVCKIGDNLVCRLDEKNYCLFYSYSIASERYVCPKVLNTLERGKNKDGEEGLGYLIPDKNCPFLG